MGPRCNSRGPKPTTTTMTMMFIRSACCLILLAVSVLSRSAANVGAGVIVQLFEWSHSDVASECEEHIGPSGFSAVQVSPPMEHIQGRQWWTRYQPVSYNLVSRSGDEEAFRKMVSRCASANVTVIVDAVTNHMASGSGTGTAGSTFGGRAYPAVGYDSTNSMHHSPTDPQSNCAVKNYQNQTNVQECDLTGLPDLNSEANSVQDTLRAYIRHLSEIGVGGYRMDAAKHQDAKSLGMILQDVQGNASIYQEVIEGVGEAVTADQYFSNGHVTEFRFAQNAVGPCFVAEDRLHELNTLVGGENDPFGVTVPSQYALVFMDNHDTQRNGNAPLTYQKSGNLYVIATVFMLAWPFGTPRVMSSYAFTSFDQGPPSYDGGMACGNDDTGWLCEHRLAPIAGMIGWRVSAADEPVQNWHAFSSNQIAFSRGGNAFVVINRDETSTLHLNTVQTGMSSGTYCNVIVSRDPSDCPELRVDANGNLLDASIPPMSALAIHVGSAMSHRR